MLLARDARHSLLLKILAVLGATAPAIACNESASPPATDPRTTPSATTADSPDPPRTCPERSGDYAEWPNDKRPDFSDGMNAVCMPKPKKGSCSAYSDECIKSRYVCGLAHGGEKVLGTLPARKNGDDEEQCCWKVKGGCAVGRPFVVDGVARVANVASGSSWSHVMPVIAIDDLDDLTRAAIADVWTRDALTEHASVASFARLALELLAVGAPANLVIGAQRAMADEILHAQRAFTLASRYADAPIEPGSLETHGALGSRVELADFAARAASEGCIAETIAALQLHAAADAARDPELARTIRLTAEEESDHALLAFQIVAWAIEKGGAPVRRAVAAVFDRAAQHVGFGPCPDESLDAATLRAHGILPRCDRHDLAVSALETVVLPAARMLLGDGPLSPVAPEVSVS